MDNHPAVLIWQYIEQGDFDSARTLLTDDFTFSDVNRDDVMTTEQWFPLHRMMNNASSDFTFNMKDPEVEGDMVKVRLQFYGTHDGPIDLSMVGGPVVEATGIHFDTPYEEVHIHMDGDLISRIETRGNGDEHLMKQLGIEMG